jgi:hypothetical protein
MTLRRFVVLCFLLVLSASLFLPAAAQTETPTNETSTPTNATPTNATSVNDTPEPTPVSETGAVDLRVSIGDQRIVEGMLIERTNLPTLDIQARSTENIRLVAIRQDGERVREFRPGKMSFEERVQPELENERNEIRIIVETNTGAVESLRFNYTYDTRGPWVKYKGDFELLEHSNVDRIVLPDGTIYSIETVGTGSIPADSMIMFERSDLTLTGTVFDASGTTQIIYDQFTPRDTLSSQVNRTHWRKNFSSVRHYQMDRPLFLPPASINEVEIEYRDKLDNLNSDEFEVYVDDDEPPTFNLQLSETDRRQELVRPTLPDADLEMIDDSEDGAEGVGGTLSALRDEDGGGGGGGGGGDDDDGDEQDGSGDTEYDIPGDGNDPVCDDRTDDGEYDADPIPDEFSMAGRPVLHPLGDHNDFDPDVYGEHYCQIDEDPNIFFFGNPDWPFPQGGPYDQEALENNEDMESETITLVNYPNGPSYSISTYFDEDQEDEDNDQAINVDLEEAPRDSTTRKQIRVTGTISDNAQLRRVTIRVGWHPKNVTQLRNLAVDNSGVRPFRPQRNVTADVGGNLTDGQIRNWFTRMSEDDEENATISCIEEDDPIVVNYPNFDPGEVGPMGPDNDPGGDVSVCPDSIEPVLGYYEHTVLSPTDAKKLSSEYQTVQLNETIPLKNRTGETITNVVEVEAQDFQGHEQRRLALVEKEPLQPEPIIDIDPQRTRTASDGRLNIAARVFDGLVRTVTVETRKDGSIYDFAEVHNGSTRTDIRIQETLDRPEGQTRVVIRAVDIRGRVHTESLRVDAIRTSTPTETPFQTEAPDPVRDPDTVEPPSRDTDTPVPTPTFATPTPPTNVTPTPTPAADRGAVFGNNFGFAAVAIALLSVAALARRRLV